MEKTGGSRAHHSEVLAANGSQHAFARKSTSRHCHSEVHPWMARGAEGKARAGDQDETDAYVAVTLAAEARAAAVQADEEGARGCCSIRPRLFREKKNSPDARQCSSFVEDCEDEAGSARSCKAQKSCCHFTATRGGLLDS
jgi:hypothetical protein